MSRTIIYILAAVNIFIAFRLIYGRKSPFKGRRG